MPRLSAFFVHLYDQFRAPSLSSLDLTAGGPLSTAVLSLRRSSLCGGPLSAAVLSLRLSSLCGCPSSSAIQSLWLSSICGYSLYLAVLRRRPSFLTAHPFNQLRAIINFVLSSTLLKQLCWHELIVLAQLITLLAQTPHLCAVTNLS